MKNSNSRLRTVVNWEQEYRTLSQILDLDLNMRREELKDALLDYEDANPGNNLVGTKVYEFLRHCQNIVWKQLAELALTNPVEFRAWCEGERGHWPLQTNNVAHGMLLRLSEGRRAQLHEPDAAIERTKNGMPVISDNIRRTVQNWRRKTTAYWVTQSGDVIKGFPFFLSWTRLNRAGAVDPKGRGNVIGLVNLKWIFGPEWVDKTAENFAVAKPHFEADREKFSTIPLILKPISVNSEKKNEGNRHFASAKDALVGSAHTPIAPSMKTAQQQGTLRGDGSFAAGEKNIAPPAAAGGALARAAALWQFLLLRLYTPLLGSGRIRFSSTYAFYGDTFKGVTADKCLELFVQNLYSAQNAGDATLEEAEIRLREAIDGQVKYMQDNPQSWVLTPDKFLRTDKPNGTLLSALRLLVKQAPTASCVPPPGPENENEKQQRDRLYARLLTLGAHRTHPGTFARWYREYGHRHLEGCLIYMGQQAARRRQEGRPVGREFDGNRGGASAYFASLVARFDSQGAQYASEKPERDKLKLRLWNQVFTIQEGQKSPELEQLRAEMSTIFFRMCEDEQFRERVVGDTNKFFHMRIADYQQPTSVVLIHYVLQLQKNDQHAPLQQ